MDGANLVGGAARRPATLTRGALRQIPDPVKEGKQGESSIRRSVCAIRRECASRLTYGLRPHR